MLYRTLGRTGLEVSEIGFGGAGAGLRNYLRRWDASQEENSRRVEEAIRAAVERGINYFDTAPLYGSEAMFGRALKPYRERVFVATKVRERNAYDTYKSIEESLERLQCECLDLIQYHGGWYTDQEVEAILKPDATIADSWVTVTMNDGTPHMGTLISKDDTAVVVNNIAGIGTTLNAADVKSIEKQTSTLMGPGLANDLSLQQFVDMVSYLHSLK